MEKAIATQERIKIELPYFLIKDLIKQLTPNQKFALKKDLEKVEPKSLYGIWEGIDFSEEEIEEVTSSWEKALQS